MFKEALAFAIALLPCWVEAAEPQEAAQPAPDYHYECGFKEDFKPHGKVLGVLEIKKIYHADGKADPTDARLTFVSANLLHDAVPPMIDGYLRGVFVTWGEDQHKELGVKLLENYDRSAYISPRMDIAFDVDRSIKIPKSYLFDETIITIGKNKLVGKYKDGLLHFVDFYSPEIMNLERIESIEGMSTFNLEDITDYSHNHDEISLYFVKTSIKKFHNINVEDRIVLQNFSLYPKDFEGIYRMYKDKILPWEKGIADYKNCEKVEDYNDIIVTKGSQ